MGMYLNPNNKAFLKPIKNPIYVDKSLLIEKTNAIIGNNDCFLCICRPRRFGKSVDANMLIAYYSKGCDSSSLFGNLKISQCDDYKKHLNQHDIIYFDVQRILSKVHSIDDFIERLSRNIIKEIKQVYADEELYEDGNLVSALENIYGKYNQSYIFIIDEL